MALTSPHPAAQKVAGILVSLALVGWLIPAGGIAAEPNKAKSQAAYERGLHADQAGHQEEAIAAFTEAVEADGSNGPAWRARGKDYLSAGDSAKAIADLDQAVKAQPGDAESYAARGTLFGALKQPDRAIQDYDIALGLDLRRADIYNLRGTIYAGIGKYEKAVDDFREAIDLSPDSPGPYRGRGMVHARFGHYREAILDFSLCLNRRPDPEVYIERAAAYGAVEEDQRALQDLDAALKLRPDDLRAHWVRGTVRELLGDNDGALADYTECIRRNPKDVPFLMTRGSVLADLKQAFGVDPSNPETEKLMAQAQRRVDEASQSTAPARRSQEAVSVAPSPVAHPQVKVDEAYEGTAATRPNQDAVAVPQKPIAQPQGTVAQAVASSVAATACRDTVTDTLRPASPRDGLIAAVGNAVAWREERDTVVLKLPGTASFLGEVQKAPVEQHTRAKSAAAYFTQGQSLLANRQYGKAIEVFTIAIRLDRRMAPAFNKRGLAHSKSQQYREAIADLNEAIRLSPGYGEAYLNRAVVRRAIGDQFGADGDQDRGCDLLRCLDMTH